MARLERYRFALQCLAVAALAALLRLPFLGSIGPDEGGYAYAAWQWARGRPLYRSIWIDRPQGLLLVYRGLVGVALEPWAIRLGAVVAGAAVSLLLVAVGTQLVSRRAGLAAGALFAAVGVGPRIEGFTFNGEIAAAVPATAAVAVSLAARAGGSRRLYAVAGLLGGAAMLMKQSGFDGAVVAVALATVGPAARRRGDALVAVAGAVVVLAASAIAGAFDGWSSYWSGVVSSHAVAIPLGRRLHHFLAEGHAPLWDLLLVGVVALIGVAAARRLPVARWLVPLWLAAAFAGVNVGGLYWPHYYVQLVPPLCLAAGIAIAQLSIPRASVAAVAVALPVFVFVGHVLGAGDERREHLVRYALGFENDRRIASFVRAHTRPDDSVFAYLSRADFYFLARRRVRFRYLWIHPLNETRTARSELLELLAAPNRPAMVALFQRPKPDSFGRAAARILRRDYREVWRAPGTGTPVLRAVRRR